MCIGFAYVSVRLQHGRGVLMKQFSKMQTCSCYPCLFLRLAIQNNVFVYVPVLDSHRNITENGNRFVIGEIFT